MKSDLNLIISKFNIESIDTYISLLLLSVLKHQEKTMEMLMAEMVSSRTMGAIKLRFD